MGFKLFDFSWLRGSERKEYEKLKQEKKAAEFSKTIRDAIEKREAERAEGIMKLFHETPVTFENLKPFKSCRLIGETCLVVLNDGTTLSKDGPELVGKVRQAQSEEEVLQLFMTVHKQENVKERQKNREEQELVGKNLEIFEGKEDFIVEGKDVFLKGVSLAIPPIVLASFIEILEKIDAEWEAIPGGCISCDVEALEEQYEALKMFWLKLCLNGREQSREDLLSFCKENDVRITKNGNLILYRNIVAIGETSKPFTEFVSQQYFKIRGYKKSPKNYWVWGNDDGTYKLITENWSNSGIEHNCGNLYDLYVDLPNHVENKYTSWNNYGKHEINIGSIYRIEEEDINLNNGLCAAGGLHAANVNYDYSSFGDTKVVVLVSPSKAITVPLGDKGKLRTTEMFVCCINDKDYGEHFSDEDLSAFDEAYNHLSIGELEESLKNKSFMAASVVEEVSPITPVDMENIKDMLKKRVVHV